MATVSTATKTLANVLVHQAVTHPNTSKGSALAVGTKIGCKLSLFHASVEAVANTNPGFFSILVSHSAADDYHWVEMYRVVMDAGTAETEAMIATEPVDETVLACASTTNLTTIGQ